MQFHDYVRSAWIRLPIILLVAAAVTLLGLRGTPATTQYESKVQVLLSPNLVDENDDTVQVRQTQLESLATLADSPDVLEPVIAELGLNMSVEAVAARVDASLESGTFVLSISAKGDTREQSEHLVTAVANSLTNQEIYLAGLNQASVVILTPSTTATAAGAGLSVQDLVKNLLIGLILGIALNVLIDLMDPRVRSRNVFASLTATPVLAEVSGHSHTSYAGAAAVLALNSPAPTRRSVVLLPSGTGEAHINAAVLLSEAFASFSPTTVLITPEVPRSSDSVITKNLEEAFPAAQPQALRDQLEALREQFDSIVIAVPDIDESATSLLLASLSDACVIVIDEARDTKVRTIKITTAIRQAQPGFVCALLVTPRRILERLHHS